jgi:N-acetylglutamate synthase-like GNAT family acetyltransferase
MSPEEYTIIIRDAETDDVPAITGLLTELGYQQEKSSLEARIMKMSKRMNDRVLVAERESRVVGVLSLHIMTMFHLGGRVCRVTSLVVSKDFRKRYIGRRLMDMAEAYARASGCVQIEVTSNARRADAHLFYDRVGYSEGSRIFKKDLDKD